MEQNELMQQLRAWGSAQVARFEYAAEHKVQRAHALDRAREFAPGTRARAALRLAGRDGRSRRRIMAAAAQVPGMTACPDWACDAIPARATRKATPWESVRDAARRSISANAAVVDRGIPRELAWVERALVELARVAPVRAFVLRTEFTQAGTQRMKAGQVEWKYGGKFSVTMYRRELRRGLDFLLGRRLAA